MKIIIENIDKGFYEILLEIRTENFRLENNRIIIEGDKVSKVRAKLNLIMRLINIYDSINDYISR